MFKRVVIKLSGEALAGDKKHFDDDIAKRIAKVIGRIVEQGTEVSLVVGGGNFFRGVQKDPDKIPETYLDLDRTKADQIGMLGTVMNAMYLSEALRLNEKPIKAVVMTPFPLHDFTVSFSVEKAEEYLSKGTVVIHAAGVGLPYFSTDTITVLRGAQLHADCILFAKNIDGVYDRHPKEKGARKYRTLNYSAILENHLDAIDPAAMNMAWEAKLTCLVYELREPENIYSACLNNEETYKIGTKIAEGIEEVFYE